ncbi:MAG: hypothetical protein V7752_06660 [Halopseudomonas sp.]
MNVQRLTKQLGGTANLFGGLLVAVAYILHPPHQTPEVISGDFWLTVHALFAPSLIFGVFGLFAIYQQHHRRSSLSGLVGFIAACISLIGIFGLNFFEAFINPVLAVEVPRFVEQHGAGTGIGWVAWLFPLSGLLFVLGYSLLCADVIKAKTFDNGPAILTLAGTLIFGTGLSGMVSMILVQVGAVVFGAGLVWFGWALIKRDQRCLVNPRHGAGSAYRRSQ